MDGQSPFHSLRNPEQHHPNRSIHGSIHQTCMPSLVRKIPTRSGRPEIIDAIGKRLIIETETGDIFYFDVPAGQFASSLTAILPTMTPGPTLTP